ncbi:MAG: endonuclease/exonuclease/phosphatase family protein [Bacteroidia bacterium]|nr:endonuclease/exonuclease/phosphatase family protein [Bacteroidia bacterium]
MARAWELPYDYEKDYYQTDRNNGFNGIATFSKFPIIRSGFLEQQPKKCFGIYTDIILEKDTLRIFNVHLASLRLGEKDIKFYYQLKKTETENINLKAGLFSILKKLKLAFILRAAEVDKLLEEIRQSPYPVLICGDMNDSPFSYTYRQLTHSLTDAYREAGEDFFGSTYDGALPNYRIDYILYDSYFKAFSYKKSNVTFSDHYPVSGIIMVAN